MRQLAFGGGPRLLLAVLALASLALPLVTHAANRLLSGGPAPAPGAIWLAAVPLLLAASALSGRGRLAHWAALGACLAGVLAASGLAGHAARLLAGGGDAAGRTMLGAGFWTFCACLGLAAADAVQCLWLPRWAVLCVAAAFPGLLGLAGGLGAFDALSLAQEAAAHRGAFLAAFSRHVLLVAVTVAVALLLGVPLGLLVQRWRPARGPIFSALNIVQTVPSVALFGLLIAPLSALGLSGIGAVPAIAALVGYALLPVVRAVVAGLDGVDAAVLDAAAGLGLSPGQRLWRVALPLAAPALLAGFRIALVQTIGLAVVAALIGAGGLGDFVFQGLGQYAVDLVLLGALPAIGLALAADLLLRLAAPERAA